MTIQIIYHFLGQIFCEIYTDVLKKLFLKILRVILLLVKASTVDAGYKNTVGNCI